VDQMLAMRTFVRVVETGSFSRAANQLALPRSTVSKLINDLEAHLGIKLLNRTTRAVATTAEGTEYHEHASRLLGEIDIADDAVRSKKLKPRGHLRVEAPPSFANCLLIPALPRFQERFPDVTVALGISDRLVSIVGEGVDCAIRAGDLADSTLIARRLATLDYATCASPAYLERKGLPLTPVDLQTDHHLVGYFVFASGKTEHLCFEKDDERLEMSEFDYAASEGNGVIQMMLSGLGIGQQIRRFVQPYLDSGELVEILPEWSRPARHYHVVYPTSRQLSGRLQAFVDWLGEEFRQR
jgi:LysR family transcriptional regulator, regulator for bpeEF and oprC